jgi:hypothetical protein
MASLDADAARCSTDLPYKLLRDDSRCLRDDDAAACFIDSPYAFPATILHKENLQRNTQQTNQPTNKQTRHVTFHTPEHI